MNISYIRILQAIEAFASQHLQIRKFASDFPEQMPNFATVNEEYPILFVSPSVEILDENVNTFDITVYCFDIILKDRININTILSDTNLILNDLYRWFRDGDIFGIDQIEQVALIPMNNALLDYAAGWQMTLRLVVNTYGVCEIPFNEPPVVITEVNDVVYSQYLTCETLPDCPAFINLQTEIDDIIPDQTGHAGDVLTTDGTDYSWQPATGGGLTCNDLAGCQTIIDIQSDISGLDSRVSAIESDYVTSSELATALSPYALTSSLSDVAFSGDYNDLINAPTQYWQEQSGVLSPVSAPASLNVTVLNAFNPGFDTFLNVAYSDLTLQSVSDTYYNSNTSDPMQYAVYMGDTTGPSADSYIWMNGGADMRIVNGSFNGGLTIRDDNFGRINIQATTVHHQATVSSFSSLAISLSPRVVGANPGGILTLSVSTSHLPEGTNLYFTNARAIASVLTGYASGAGTISSADTVLSAIQKLNGNISAMSNYWQLIGADLSTATVNDSLSASVTNTMAFGDNSFTVREDANVWSTVSTSVTDPNSGDPVTMSLAIGDNVIPSTDSYVWLSANGLSMLDNSNTGIRMSAVSGGIALSASGQVQLISTSAQVTALSGTGTRMVTVGSTGFLSTAALPSTPSLASVTAVGSTTATDIEITSSASGLILVAPNSNRYRVTVDNTGNLNTTLI